MCRWLMFAMLIVFTGNVFAQETDDTTACRGPWRLEYQMMIGNVRVTDIEDIPQPKIGAVSQSSGFLLGLEYRLGNDWSLYGGAHVNSRQGMAMADGIPFELQENGLDIPILLRVNRWVPLGGLLPSVGFEAGIGPYYGMVFGMKAYELPEVFQPRAIGADADAFAYHHLGILAELRFRIRLTERDAVSVGVHVAQDLLTFGAGDDQPIIPRFSLGGIAIGYSRPIF
ncbi:MAG: hypothetical protein IH600_15520 [Bacteroidetes bacterium]|nr:hypothetical protein [Bacteroidota bacterium]